VWAWFFCFLSNPAHPRVKKFTDFVVPVYRIKKYTAAQHATHRHTPQHRPPPNIPV
jgi:hypothetical protein